MKFSVKKNISQKFLIVLLVSITVLSQLAMGQHRPSRVEFSPRGKKSDQFKYYNVGKEFKPAISVFAITDRSKRPVRHLSGVTLNGQRIINRMLTGSVLRVNPDGSGMYMYNTGYLGEVDGIMNSPLQDVKDVDRNTFDPEGQTVPGDKLYLLRKGKPVKLTYKLDFPSGVKIKDITLIESSFGLKKGTKVISIASSEPSSFKSDATNQTTGEGHKIKKVFHVIGDGVTYKHELKDIDSSVVYLTITAKNPTPSLHLQGVAFWATLSYDKPLNIVASHGENQISFEDDESSSHMGRIYVGGGRGTGKLISLMEAIKTYNAPMLDALEGVYVPKPTRFDRMKKINNPQHFFPMGVYDGQSSPHRDFMLKDLKEHNMNTWWVSNVYNHKDFLGLLKDAEAWGIRLVWESSNHTGLTPEQVERDIKPYRRQYLLAPNLLLWVLAEEIPSSSVKKLTPLFETLRSIDGWPAPAILHNNTSAADADAKVNKPLIITSDTYPFFGDPRCGPSSTGNIKRYYFGQLTNYYRAARECGASYWIMPQSWHQRAQVRSQPPYFGPSWLRPKMSAAMTKWQIWTAVAHGATGVVFYPYRCRGDSLSAFEWETMRNWKTWEKTDMLRGAADAFGKLKKVGAVLCHLERDFKDKEIAKASDDRILVRSFKPRKGSRVTGNYLVLANTDWTHEVCFELIKSNTDELYYDCIRESNLQAGAIKSIVLGPGEGTVISIKGEKVFQKDLKRCKLPE